ncbi:hypothetical protein JCM6882_007697, partial [Rhodosporidiobolus microsporus]
MSTLPSFMDALKDEVRRVSSSVQAGGTRKDEIKVVKVIPLPHETSTTTEESVTEEYRSWAYGVASGVNELVGWHFT